MKRDFLMFDLDGTVIDSGEGVKNSALYALEKLGYPAMKREDMDCFIGPPLTYSFHRFAGVAEEECDEAVRLYRIYYREMGGMAQYRLYDGIKELLFDLKRAGYRTSLATSKPQVFAEHIAQESGFGAALDFIVGATMDERTRATKSDVIREALRLSGVEAQDAYMIGDRKYDILGAKEVGVPAIGITYGYGDREELTLAGADVVYDTVDELRRAFL